MGDVPPTFTCGALTPGVMVLDVGPREVAGLDKVMGVATMGLVRF